MRLSPHRSLPLVLLQLAFVLFTSDVEATPPDYATFDRGQTAAHQPDTGDVMRIWALYIGQGDSLLIQMPTRFSYDSDGNGTPDERIDILVDGGPANTSNPSRQLRRHINTLYPNGSVIEHVVITHHDYDHIGGLSALLEDPAIGVDTIYHNGLASYRPNARRLDGHDLQSEPSILKEHNGQIIRVMGLLDDGEQLRADFLINSRAELETAFRLSELQGVYHDLARAVLEKDEPFPVSAFVRVTDRSDFIMEVEAEREGGLGSAQIEIDPIWPRDRPRRFGDWGQSINGNSVTFRLAYGEFSMLFTGDHNQLSEKELREHLGENTGLLDCDVLKVPHHGSRHFEPEFFQINTLSPVVSVASQGGQGFFTDWEHPSTDLIRRLGRSHRVYNTFIHESRFDYDDLPTRADREPFMEESHVLVETDGEFFRVVEVTDLSNIPSVAQTRRGNGTLWVQAD